MKLAVALGIVAFSLASSVVAQGQPEEVPWTLPSRDWVPWSYYNSHPTPIEGTVDAITLRYREFYERADGVTPKILQPKDGMYYYSAQLVFKLKREERHYGWRAKVLNATVSFPFVTTAGAGVNVYAGQRWDWEFRQFLTEFGGPTIYAAAAGNSTFVTTLSSKNGQTQWGPCTGAPDWTDDGTTIVGMNFFTHVDLVSPGVNQSLPDGTPWSATAGRSGQPGDFEVHYNLIWEGCNATETLSKSWTGQ